MKLSEWIIEIPLYIAYLLVIIIPPFLYIWTPIETSQYLHKQYSRNWNSSYITNLTITLDATCPIGFELKTLGYWSGVKSKSCLCKNKLNETIQFATDDFNSCQKGDVQLLYNCKEISSAPPVSLTKYKNIGLCIKREAHSLEDVHKFLKNGKEAIRRADYPTHFKELLSKNISITKETIVDIVIAKSPPSGYANIYTMSDGNSVYIRRGNNSMNIYAYNDLIADIHFFNELSCSYIDMSYFNPLKSTETIEYVNYGGNKHCESFNVSQLNIPNFNIMLNDGNKRLVIINKDYLTDPTLSLNNIYSGTAVSDYYSSNQIALLIQSSNLPVLVYQRYLYGLGCPMMKSISWHLLQYDNMILCKNLAIAIAFFTIVAFVMGVVFLIIKLFDNLKGYPCTYCFLAFFFLFMISISLILIVTYLSLMGVSIRYFKEFGFYCQVDYRGGTEESIVKTSRMEFQFISDMEFAMSIGIGLLVVIVLTIIIQVGYYFIVCKEHSPMREFRNNQIEMEKLK